MCEARFVRCSLTVAHCLSSVVCRLLSRLCCSLFVATCLVSGVRSLQYVFVGWYVLFGASHLCRWLFAVCCLLFVVRCLLFVARCLDLFRCLLFNV